MQESYQLYPNDEDERLTSFLKLFIEKYPSNTWTVANACTYLYLSDDYLSVRLKIVNTNTTEYIKIFSVRQ